MQYRGRQRQKLRHRMILIITATAMACVVIIITVILNTGNVDESTAAVSIYTVIDENPVTEKTLDEPVIKQLPTIGPNTVFVRPIKTVLKTAESHQ